jgi:hypothetical protein
VNRGLVPRTGNGRESIFLSQRCHNLVRGCHEKNALHVPVKNALYTGDRAMLWRPERIRERGPGRYGSSGRPTVCVPLPGILSDSISFFARGSFARSPMRSTPSRRKPLKNHDDGGRGGRERALTGQTQEPRPSPGSDTSERSGVRPSTSSGWRSLGSEPAYRTAPNNANRQDGWRRLTEARPIKCGATVMRFLRKRLFCSWLFCS